jgi:K+-sensing histidine kinase KdpD
MWLSNKALAVTVSLALVAAVTLILWYIKVETGNTHQLVYFYLFPVLWVRILFSDALAALCALLAAVCADYFLQDPPFSFYIYNDLDFGDLVCFVALSLLSIQCIFSEPLLGRKSETRPSESIEGYELREPWKQDRLVARREA